MPLPRHSSRARQGSLWRHWSLWIYFPLALLLILVGVCLWKSGRWLVKDDPFDKARWAVVLAGEGRNAERSEEALKLYLEGRIDTLIYSGLRVFKDRYSSEFMTDWLAKQGYPREKMFEFHQDAYSTQEEAGVLIRQFRQQNLDTVLIITASFHTARTRRIFRKLAQGYPHVLVHAAPLEDYDPAAWWSSRESRKYWLLEWTKTVSTFFELMSAPPETGKSEVSELINKATGSVPDLGTAFLPPPSRLDSSAVAALDSVAHPDSASARKDTAASAAADSGKAPASDSGKTGKAAPGEKAETKPDEPSSREILAAREPAPKKETRETKSSKDSANPKASAAKPAAKSAKPDPAPAKSSAKKTADKAPEKASKASDKDKKKSK